MLILLWVLAGVLGALLLAFGWWRFHFFHRNPTRVIPPGRGVLAPADGRVLYCDEIDLDLDAGATLQPYHQRVREAFAATGPWTVVATYLSIFDVHVVRAPVAGRVRLRQLDPIGANQSMGASFLYSALRRPLPVGKRGYADKNEFLGLELLAPGDSAPRLLLVLMADWWIDQIVAYVSDGAEVERGQVIAKIQMGSQVDLWATAGSLELRRQRGDRVKAGETVLAEPR